MPTRLSISTKVSIVNFAVFWFTTSDARRRDTNRIRGLRLLLEAVQHVNRFLELGDVHHPEDALGIADADLASARADHRAMLDASA